MWSDKTRNKEIVFTSLLFTQSATHPNVLYQEAWSIPLPFLKDPEIMTMAMTILLRSDRM